MIRQAQIQNVVDTFSNHTVSLYLYVDAGYIENQAETSAWQIYLKNAMSDISDEMTTKQTSAWKSINSKVEEFMQSYSPGGKTLALFVDDENWFAEELPFHMENQHYYGQPYVSPLLWAIDEHEEYLIVMVDSESAQFHQAYLGNLETENEMHIDLNYDWVERTQMPATDGNGEAVRQGNNREAFDDMITAHINRFYGDVAQQIRTYMQENGKMRLILAGDERAANALKNKIHESAMKQFVGIVSIPMDANQDEIMKRIAPVAYNYERDFEYELIENLISAAHAGGLGAIGRDEIETAMDMQQVEQFVLPYSTLSDDTDYAHRIAMWSLRNNSSIEFVHGQAARKVESSGGIIARLYYTIEPA